MVIKQLSSAMHNRIMGRPAKPMDVITARRIAQYIGRFFSEAPIDQSPDVELPLPTWAPTFDELDNAILSMAMPYIEQITAWLSVTALPEPTHWNTPPGWSKWGLCQQWLPIDQPPKCCHFLDIESVPVEWYQFSTSGKPEPTVWAPVCSIALSLTDIYCWRADTNNTVDSLDLLYPGMDGLSIGHNIGYDQSYSVREHIANLDDWSARPMALDTMGLWMTTRGHSNQQRALVNLEDGWTPAWADETTGAGLADIYEFYFGDKLEKGVRDNIVNDGWSYVKDNFSTVLSYCYSDVVANAQVFQALLPEWIEANTYNGETQWLTLWSMLLQSQYWCPIDDELAPVYFTNAEKSYQEIKQSLNADLIGTAELLLQQYNSGVMDAYRHEQLTEQLDWTIAKSGKRKGLPQWYRTLLTKPSIGSKVAPIILGFTWKGELLRYNDTEGYHTAHGIVDNPDKRGKPVHSMLMKGFKDDARLGAVDGTSEAVLRRYHSMLNWTSLRKRIASFQSFDVEGYPAFKDKIRVGTVTRRLTSSVTQVLPKMDKVGCVGANVRALLKAPEGTKFVEADFDSQELLLAAELGDSEMGYRGASPFSVSCHIGQKETRTTPHYLLADSAQIDYTLAKNIGYAVIYGQSVKGSVDYFLMANKSMTKAEALERATTTHNKQKGVRDRRSGLYSNGAASPTYNQLHRLCNNIEQRSLLSHQKMTKALSEAKGDYVTTRQNWFIQEAGSSMRDRLVLYTWYLMQRYGIVGRLVMTVHDEAIFCVEESQATLMAYILQLAHLYITGWKTDRLGLDCLPAGQSYFSSVEVDTRWRKSPKANPPSTPDMPNTVWANGYSLNPEAIVKLIESGQLSI